MRRLKEVMLNILALNEKKKNVSNLKNHLFVMKLDLAKAVPFKTDLL